MKTPPITAARRRTLTTSNGNTIAQEIYNMVDVMNAERDDEDDRDGAPVPLHWTRPGHWKSRDFFARNV